MVYRNMIEFDAEDYNWEKVAEVRTLLAVSSHVDIHFILPVCVAIADCFISLGVRYISGFSRVLLTTPPLPHLSRFY